MFHYTIAIKFGLHNTEITITTCAFNFKSLFSNKLSNCYSSLLYIFIKIIVYCYFIYFLSNKRDINQDSLSPFIVVLLLQIKPQEVKANALTSGSKFHSLCIPLATPPCMQKNKQNLPMGCRLNN